MIPDPLPTHAWLTGLFPEKETCGGDPVANRKTLQLQGAILKQNLRTIQCSLMKMKRKTQPALTCLEMQVQDLFESGRSIHVQRPRSPQQIERGDQPGQAKIVVPVKVRDTNVINAHHANALGSQCNLCPLPTIKQKLFFVDVDDLCCWVSARQRERSTASQNMDLEAQAL